MAKKQKPSQQRRGNQSSRPIKQPNAHGPVMSRRPPRQPGR